MPYIVHFFKWVYDNISVGNIYHYPNLSELSRFQMWDNIETLLRYFLNTLAKITPISINQKELPRFLNTGGPKRRSLTKNPSSNPWTGLLLGKTDCPTLGQGYFWESDAVVHDFRTTFRKAALLFVTSGLLSGKWRCCSRHQGCFRESDAVVRLPNRIKVVWLTKNAITSVPIRPQWWHFVILIDS